MYLCIMFWNKGCECFTRSSTLATRNWLLLDISITNLIERPKEIDCDVRPKYNILLICAHLYCTGRTVFAYGSPMSDKYNSDIWMSVIHRTSKIFGIHACGDKRIVLTQDRFNMDNSSSVIIGGWSNTQSGISNGGE